MIWGIGLNQGSLLSSTILEFGEDQQATCMNLLTLLCRM